jgi:hypothetical protein
MGTGLSAELSLILRRSSCDGDGPFGGGPFGGWPFGGNNLILKGVTDGFPAFRQKRAGFVADPLPKTTTNPIPSGSQACTRQEPEKCWRGYQYFLSLLPQLH